MSIIYCIVRYKSVQNIVFNNVNSYVINNDLITFVTTYLYVLYKYGVGHSARRLCR